MEIPEVDLFNEIKVSAENKGYKIKVMESDTSVSLGLASHYVDYQKKEIIITLPSQDHNELEALFVHELLHAELFLNGYPRILRCPAINYNDMESHLANEIEDRAHHVIIYPRMKELGYKHDGENVKFGNMVFDSLKNVKGQKKGHKLIFDALNILEVELRNKNIHQEYDSKIKREYPLQYAIYRRFKRLYSFNSQRTMRDSIYKVFREIEGILNKEGNEFKFNNKFYIPLILNEYEKKQICSKYLNVVKIPGSIHNYIMDTRTNECVFIVDSNEHSVHQIDKMLNENTLVQFFG